MLDWGEEVTGESGKFRTRCSGCSGAMGRLGSVLGSEFEEAGVLRSAKAPNDGECEIHARGDPSGSEDIAVGNDAFVHSSGPVFGEQVSHRPVRGRAPSLKESGCSERDRASADACHQI